MSNKTYDILKFIALIIVPVVNFLFLILTTVGIMDATTAATIIAGLDVLVGAIVSAAKQVWDKQQKAKKQKKTKKKEE
jgi:uncharacterized spore protein YtfJ